MIVSWFLLLFVTLQLHVDFDQKTNHNYYRMKRKLLIFGVLSLLLPLRTMAQESDLLSHRRIDLFNIKVMPGMKGKDHRDSIVNNRIWRAEQPRLYEYLPGREEVSGTAVIVIPGGGYVKQAYETAGVSFAKWLNTMGVTAFVLLHRMPGQPDVVDATTAPLADAQRAVKWVRAHASDYGITPNRIGVIGCSAGAHLAACVNVVKDDYSCCGDTLDSKSFRPNFAILVSPAGILKSEGEAWKTKDIKVKRLLDRFPIDSLVDSTTAPMLMIHASDDRVVSPLSSVGIYRALLKAGVKQSSLHIFPHGGHNIALRKQPGSTALWTQLAEMWMREIGVLPGF